MKRCTPPGGVLMYGIPEFRLPKDDRAEGNRPAEGSWAWRSRPTWSSARCSPSTSCLNMGYEAVFIGSGAGLPSFMNIPGESLDGRILRQRVPDPHQSDEGLSCTSTTPPSCTPSSVAVVGGGNVAMDAARCAKRLGAENVYIVYRRSEEEMPARKEEVEHAKEEGIIFQPADQPGGDSRRRERACVKGMDCVEMELGEPDASGRRRPVEKEGSQLRAGGGLRGHRHRHLARTR